MVTGMSYQMDHIWWASSRLKNSPGLLIGSQYSRTLYRSFIVTLYTLSLIMKGRYVDGWEIIVPRSMFGENKGGRLCDPDTQYSVFCCIHCIHKTQGDDGTMPSISGVRAPSHQWKRETHPWNKYIFGSNRSPRCRDVVCPCVWAIPQKNIENEF